MGRPIPSWYGFVGQRSTVKSLQDHCRGALAKGEPLPHTQLGGPSGIGKTELAKAVATEMQVVSHEFYSSRQSKKWQLAHLLADVEQADIVFIDEIHSLPIDCQELLFPAIDRHQVPAVDMEKRRVCENEWIDIPLFTLIAATDQPGLLRNALTQRIVLPYTLDLYSVPEMRQIILNYAAELNVLLKPQAATRLAEAARGVPRRARQLLQSLRTVMLDLQVEVTKGMVTRHLASIGIDADNLTAIDRQYLRILRDRNSSVSLRNLAVQLGTDVDAVQRDIEGYLMSRGLVGIQSRGRFLTEVGKAFVAGRSL